MNKIVLFSILLLISIVAHSAEPTDSAWSIVKPQECRFSGEFTQSKFLTGLDNALVSTGVFFYDCELGIIWKTLSPNNESLVLNKTGDSYLVKRLKIETIQTAQNKLVSQLIMALVSGDQDYLAKTFELSRTNSEKILLTPTNRRLKRAIKSITLDASKNDQISFAMLDQNQQTTSILATVTSKYPSAESALNSTQICVQISALNTTECGLLNTETN